MHQDILLQYQIFLAIAPVTAVFLTFLAAVIYNARRTVKTAYPLFGLCALLVGLIVCNALEQVTTTPAGTIFFAKFSYWFLTAIPVVWFVFALRYAGQDDPLPFPRILLLFALPLLSDILVATNEWHGLIWSRTDYVSIGPLLTLRVEHGFWFYIAALYNYALMLGGAWIIFRAFLRSSGVYRRQASWILAGVLFPLIGNIVYLFKLFPGLVKDYTCFGLFFSMICFYIGTFRYRLLELLPIARAIIIEQMREGVIIIDSDATILDLNPQAQKIVAPKQPLAGRPFADVASLCPDLYRVCTEMMERRKAGEKSGPDGPPGIELSDGETQRYFDVECLPIIRNHGSVGELITLHDSTDRVMLLRRIEQLAQTDELTGLYNRRYFLEYLKCEIERSKRYGKALSIGILDIDFFKRVNDAYGHPAGDAVLARFGEILAASLRESDVVARLGGEEFGVLMPETSARAAYSVCCRLRERIEQQVTLPLVAEEGKIISFTVSIGVAGTEGSHVLDVRDLFEKADKALYRSKNEGRNRVTLWEPEAPD
ncbi:MAG: diguanylate cyclase [Smithellaceae bacterium]|jgi:diguanylate cyclase (GGDEF)-like protein|nr:diguanylate cyclase [Syntrophaceae bacterium]MDD4240660.1 diguanylate cyclase [Smithellaceae bacterium]NLX52007.1 diguanylate cyclase [Deltaproteobacteria bacterium]